MRVVLACHRYHPVPGGSERIAQLLAEAAARAGHDVTVVTQGEPGLPERERHQGVDVRRLRMRHVDGVRVPVAYLRTLRSLEADVFHLHGNRIWCADFYLPAAGLFAWPQLGTGHGFYQYAIGARPWDRWYFERYFPRVLRNLDLYVCDTEHERQQLLAWGFPPEKLERVPLGAVTEEFGRSPIAPETVRAGWGFRAPHVAVYVGGFFANKRVDRLVEAVARTRGRWALVAIGRDLADSPYRRDVCAALARERGVEFLAPGALPREATVAAMLAGDVILSGSEYEGFGVTLAEALAAGRPFVAWRTGAAPEMAETGGGRVVGSVEECAAALEDLEDAGRRAAMGARGRAASPEWSEAAMARRYLAIYARLAARAG